MVKEHNTYVAIIAGGIGSRFWPDGRTSNPIQFLDVLNKGESLLRSTYNLYSKIVPSQNIFIVTSQDYINLVKGQIPECPGNNIIGKRQRNNTDPCIALITDKINKIDPSASLIVAPSDNIIERKELFMADVTSAISLARQGRSVTLGITPTHPNSAYDHIIYNSTKKSGDAHQIMKFIEKPEHDLADQYLCLGNSLWNSGIFVWNVTELHRAFKKYKPKMHRAFQKQKHLFNTSKGDLIMKNIYAQCGIISIGHVVLEKADNIYVITASFTWVDLGKPSRDRKHSENDRDRKILQMKKATAPEPIDTLVNSAFKSYVPKGGKQDLMISDDDLLVLIRANEHDLNQLVNIKKDTDQGRYY